MVEVNEFPQPSAIFAQGFKAMSSIITIHPSAADKETSSQPPIVHGGHFLTEILPTWTDLSPERVRDLKSAVSCTARNLGIPKENLALDYATLNSLLKRGSIAAQKTHPNVISRLRSSCAVSILGAARSEKSNRSRPSGRRPWTD